LSTDSVNPLGTENIGWALSVGDNTDAVLEEVTIVATQASSVSGIKGLAESVGKSAYSIGEIRASRALQAGSSVPLCAEDIARQIVVGD